jgi:lipopolysaccharide/colanic/teichoic acid biosynthesis glycosyltransferase
MHRGAGLGAPITSAEDSRVFRFGKWLRDAKLDELPQLFNVIKGDMAIVGPRPEDPTIVRQHYTAENFRTLDVLPGLASPGSIFNYTHGQQTLVGDDATASYVNNLLPIKLALDGVYVERASVFYDVRIIARTLRILLSRAAGKRHFPEPPEFNVLQCRLDKRRLTRWADRA